MTASILAAVATAICALELLVVRRAFSEHGVFARSVLRTSRVGDLVFAERGFTIVVALQLASAIAIPFTPYAAGVAAVMVFLVAVRFRGTYNGGSDAMLFIVLVAHALSETSLAYHASLYAAVQLTLSYFIAGIAKLGDRAWRTGRALPIVVTLPHYRVPAWARSLLSSPLGRSSATGMLVLECAFPLAWLDGRIGVALLAAGALFHLVNAIVFGLNRFLWIWLAAYPFLVERF